MSDKQYTRDLSTLSTAVNLVYNGAKRKLEDRKTTIFIWLCIAMIALLVLVYGKLDTMQQVATIKQDQTQEELNKLRTQYEITNIYLAKLNKEK